MYTTVVFGRGVEISFVKQIPTGGEKFNQQIAAKLGVSVKEAEMLRGSLRKERANVISSMEDTLPSTSCVAAAGESVGENNLQVTAEQDGTVNTVSAVALQQESGRLDTVTRQTIVDSINSVAEELSREVSLCLRYYTVTFRGRRIERAVVTGGGAYEGILLDVMRQQLGVEIEIAQPLRGFDMADVKFDGCKRSLLCEWAVAAGLGLKGWRMPLQAAGEDQLPHIGKRALDKDSDYEGN